MLAGAIHEFVLQEEITVAIAFDEPLVSIDYGGHLVGVLALLHLSIENTPRTVPNHGVRDCTFIYKFVGELFTFVREA